MRQQGEDLSHHHLQFSVAIMFLNKGPDFMQKGSQAEVHRCEAGELRDAVRHRLLVQNV